MSMTSKDLRKEIESMIEFSENTGILENDSKIIIFLLDNCEIDIPDENRFFVNVNSAESAYAARNKRIHPFASLFSEAGLSEGIKSLAFTGGSDHGHTSVDWESVIKLGIYGLRERIAKYSASCKKTAQNTVFYECLLKVYDASLRFIRRAGEYAISKQRTEMGSSLIRLSCQSPSNLFEAMQTSLIYYTLQQFFDGTYLRTLGRVDSLL